MDREHLVKDLIHASRVLRETGCLPATDGNFSARLHDERVVLTMRGIEKRSLSEWDVVEVSLNDESPIDGSTEWGLHRALYRSRPEIGCVLHVHAPALTSFAAAHVVPSVELLAEAVQTIGEIALIPFSTPGTPEVGERLVAANQSAMIYLLSNHGAVAVGSTVREALYRLERAEFLARVQIGAVSLGGGHLLSTDQLASLVKS